MRQTVEHGNVLFILKYLTLLNGDGNHSSKRTVLHHLQIYIFFFLSFFFFLQNFKKLCRSDDGKHKTKWGWPNDFAKINYTFIWRIS